MKLNIFTAIGFSIILVSCNSSGGGSFSAGGISVISGFSGGHTNDRGDDPNEMGDNLPTIDE